MNYTQLIWDCWTYGASYLPMCGFSAWAAALFPFLGGGEIIPVGSRRFRILQKLGEGGYAVVYLVSELATPEHPHPDPELRALKRVLVHSDEHFDAVQQEMLIQSTVHHHTNILPLLDYGCSGAAAATAITTAATTRLPPALAPVTAAAVAATAVAATAAALTTPPAPLPPPGVPSHDGASRTGGGGVPLTVSPGAGGVAEGDRVACFLFPVFRDGTLASELERLAAAGHMLPTSEVLSVFGQLARATAHIHAHNYAHRDIKPLNVLIAINSDHPASRQQQQRQQRQIRGVGWKTDPGAPGVGVAGGGGGGARWGIHSADDLEAGLALTGSAGDDKISPGSTDSGLTRYRCLLMDFGSARPREAHVATRSQALQIQEDAEAHCSAPYRAPELFDVPSPASLDFGAADVWALGASLFHMMYGEPPFHRAMNAAGGSLALAVLNCAIGWPRPSAPTYPPEIHQLVLTAMAPEPSARPSAAQLADMVAALRQKTLPDPAPQQPNGTKL